VALTVPSTAAQLVAERDYLHGGSQQLFKRVLAIPGDNVCLLGDVYTVNGEVIGAILGADRQGRALRPWQFCGMVGADTYWVGTRAPRSFDSRYFGPVRASAFLAGLEPWWTF
jgi:type IV secretory pathway protease TraF